MRVYCDLIPRFFSRQWKLYFSLSGPGFAKLKAPVLAHWVKYRRMDLAEGGTGKTSPIPRLAFQPRCTVSAAVFKLGARGHCGLFRSTLCSFAMNRVKSVM